MNEDATLLSMLRVAIGDNESFNSTLRILRQDPLEAILVIFGLRALIFFLFESS